MHIKYPNIENTYREKTITKLFYMFPEFKDKKFVACEKLDGSNCGIQLGEDLYTIQSRRQLATNEFFNVYDFFYENQYYLEIMNEYMMQQIKKGYDAVIFFGEYFGEEIQRKINYDLLTDIVNGKKRGFRIFDVCLIKGDSNQYVPFSELEQSILQKILVPKIKVGSFEELINIDVEKIKSEYSSNDIAEGIVIKPYNTWNSRFIFKKKIEKFQEQPKKFQAQPKKSKKKTSLDNKILNLAEQFKGYINENRLNSLFSKEGMIKDIKELGKYVKLLLQDAWKDFNKDVNIDELNKKEIKAINKLATTIAKNLIIKYT